MAFRKRGILLLALSAAAAAAPRGAEKLPVHVGGRVVREPGGALGFGWPGVYFEGRFQGSAVRVRFEAPAEHMRLTVNGEEKMLFKWAGSVDTLIGNLPPGEHVVRLEKLTESQTGGGRFLGFFAEAGSSGLPTSPKPRQIEFIGDSYTVGYGNLSPVRECSGREVHDRTDTQQAFGAIVARRLGADYRINAYSGYGMVRNYNGGSPGESLPLIYSRLKPDRPAQVEPADAGWRPQLIVINLGTNDFSTPLKAGERWASPQELRSSYRRAYVDFVRRLHRRHPAARFILMGSEAFAADVEQVAASLSATPAIVTTVRFGELDLTGCDWHPSLADNRKLADLIMKTIAEQPVLWSPARR